MDAMLLIAGCNFIWTRLPNMEIDTHAVGIYYTRKVCSRPQEPQHTHE